MAAPRSTSLRALRSLSQQSPATPLSSAANASQFRRNLHITGAQSARPASGPDRHSLYLSRSLADLKGECQKRSLRTGGNKAELVDRLSNHDVLQTRAFSIAMRRIDRQAFGGGNNSNNSTEQQQQTTRTFNTSRANKTVNDSSTIDFAYMPTDYNYANVDLPAYMINNFANPTTMDGSQQQQQPRIPTPPDAYARQGMAAQPPSPSPAPPMKPEIHFVGEMGDMNGPSPLSEVVDNDAAEIDPFHLTELVGRARRSAAAAVESSSASVASASAVASNKGGEAGGVVKELWGGFVDDVFGKRSEVKSS